MAVAPTAALSTPAAEPTAAAAAMPTTATNPFAGAPMPAVPTPAAKVVTPLPGPVRAQESDVLPATMHGWRQLAVSQLVTSEVAAYTALL